MLLGMSGKHGSGKTFIAKLLLNEFPRISRYDIFAFYITKLYKIKNFSLKNISIYTENELQRLININYNEPHINDIVYMFNTLGINDINYIEKINVELHKFKNLDIDEANTIIFEIINSEKINYEIYNKLLQQQDEILSKYFNIIVYYIYNIEEALLFKRNNNIIIYIDNSDFLNSYLTSEDKFRLNLEKREEFDKIRKSSTYIIENNFSSEEKLKDKFYYIIERLDGQRE